MRLLLIGLAGIIFILGFSAALYGADQGREYSVSDFAREASARHFTLSPGGERLLHQEKLDGRWHLVISDVSPDSVNVAHQHKLADDIHTAGAFWLDNDTVFLFEVRFQGKQPKREEEPSLMAYTMKADGSDKRLLWEEKPSSKSRKSRKGRKRKPVHKVSFSLLHALPDHPDHVLLTRIEQTPEKKDDRELDIVSDIFRMNIRTGTMKKVTPEHDLESARMFSWVPDSDGIIRLGYGETGKDDEPVLLVRKDAESKWTRLHDNELFERGKFFPVAFSSDPDILYVTSYLATGRAVLYRFSIKRGRLKGKVFAHPSADAGAIFQSPDQSRILAVSYYDDEFRLQALDDKYARELDNIRAAIGHDGIRPADANLDRSRQIIMVGDERSPLKPWLYFSDSKTAISLTDPSPWINADDMAKVKTVHYRARDSLFIPAYLTLPSGQAANKPLAAIILPHGGPYVRDYKEWNDWAQFLANRGYAVLQPNFRGSTGYGARFTTLGYGEFGGDMQQDLADGARWMIAEGIADPGRICIVGGSYGGYAALMGLIQDSDLFRCGIAWAPVTDLKQILVQDNAWDEDYAWYWQVTGGLKSGKLKAISPRHQAKKIGKPLLLMHGTEDDIVFINQSRWLAQAMKKNRSGAEFKYIEMPETGHHLGTVDSREQFLSEMEAFLSRHNPAQQPLANNNQGTGETK